MNSKELPVGTTALVGISVAVFLLTKLVGLERFWIFYATPSAPFRLFGLPWITSQFIHSSFPHLFNNLFLLFLCGPKLETRIGSKPFIYLFLWSAIGGDLTDSLLAKTETFSCGASGGVAGIIVYYLLTFSHISGYGSESKDSDNRNGIPTYWLLIYFLATNFLGALFLKMPISFLSHLGGAAVGFVCWAALDLDIPDLRSISRRLYLSLPQCFLIFSLFCFFLGSRAVYHEVKAQSKILSPDDPNYFELTILRDALDKGDEKKLKKMAQGFRRPADPELEPNALVKRASLEEVVALAPRLGIDPNSASFQYFITLFKEVPVSKSGQVLGYSERKSKEEQIAEEVQREIASDEPILILGVDFTGAPLVVTSTRIRRGDRWFPFDKKKYSQSTTYEFEGGLLLIEHNPERSPVILMNGASLSDWPYLMYSAEL